MEEYKKIFYIIYFLYAFIAIFTAIALDVKKSGYQAITVCFGIAFMLAYTCLFGLRDISVGTDTEMYHWQYIHYDEITFGTDALVGLIFRILNSFSENPQLFLLLMSLLFVTVNFYALKKHATFYKSNFLLVTFSLISLFFFESLGINVIRQGVSLAFFVLAIVCHNESPKRKWLWILFFILAIGFHFTSLIIVLIYFIVIKLKKIRIEYYYVLYLISVTLATMGVSILSFKDYFVAFLVVDERRSGYLEGVDAIYDIGFKPQFVAFNTVFLFLFFWLNRLEKSSFYTNLLKYYITISSLFYMMFQIPYSDRWGVMSWCVIPLLFAPLFKVSRERRTIKSMLSAFFLIFIFLFFQLR